MQTAWEKCGKTKSPYTGVSNACFKQLYEALAFPATFSPTCVDLGLAQLKEKWPRCGNQSELALANGGRGGNGAQLRVGPGARFEGHDNRREGSKTSLAAPNLSARACRVRYLPLARRDGMRRGSGGARLLFGGQGVRVCRGRVVPQGRKQPRGGCSPDGLRCGLAIDAGFPRTDLALRDAASGNFTGPRNYAETDIGRWGKSQSGGMFPTDLAPGRDALSNSALLDLDHKKDDVFA